MRFEIGPGGMLVVLLGLLGLSGAVFGLGLIAGHELAGPEAGAAPVAAAYPVPAAPAGSEEPSDSTASAPASVPARSDAKNASSGTVSPDEDTGAATAAVDTAVKAPVYSSADKVTKAPLVTRRKPASAQVASKGSHKSSASDEDEDLAPGSAVAPPSSSSSAPSETADTSGGDETEDDSAPPAPAQPVHKRLASVNPSSSSSSVTHPYSIQIDAMMDQQGAQQMEQKLRAKGFQPYMVPTQLGGKTWYRLRVGHYATPADAQAAEAKLHQEFNDTPSSH
jgi:septal ring-binding cell division protein DamX